MDYNHGFSTPATFGMFHLGQLTLILGMISLTQSIHPGGLSWPLHSHDIGIIFIIIGGSAMVGSLIMEAILHGFHGGFRGFHYLPLFVSCIPIWMFAALGMPGADLTIVWLASAMAWSISSLAWR